MIKSMKVVTMDVPFTHHGSLVSITAEKFWQGGDPGRIQFFTQGVYTRLMAV